jgi:hypothetical protein
MHKYTSLHLDHLLYFWVNLLMLECLGMSTGSRVHYNHFAQVVKANFIKGESFRICIHEGHIFWEFTLQENPKVCIAEWNSRFFPYDIA